MHAANFIFSFILFLKRFGVQGNPLLAIVFFPPILPSHIAVVARKQEMCNREILPCQSDNPTRAKVLTSQSRQDVRLFKNRTKRYLTKT